jgi:hypothetical protein
VVVNDFDLVGISISPSKADPELVVDPKAPLTVAISSQPLQPVSRRLIEILDSEHPMDLAQFPERHSFNCRIPAAVPMSEYLFRIGIGKRADHALAFIVTR